MGILHIEASALPVTITLPSSFTLTIVKEDGTPIVVDGCKIIIDEGGV